MTLPPDGRRELLIAGEAWGAFVILGGIAGVVTYALLAPERAIEPRTVAVLAAILAGGVVSTLSATVPVLRRLIGILIRDLSGW
jgi:hypothetical protein